jgi:hypothetical protein
MPHIDSTFMTIFGTIFLVLLLAFRSSSLFGVKISSFRGKPLIKKFDNPDDAIKELETMEEQAKQSGASPEEVKILTDLEDMIKQSQQSGKKVNFVVNKSIRIVPSINITRKDSFNKQ